MRSSRAETSSGQRPATRTTFLRWSGIASPGVELTAPRDLSPAAALARIAALDVVRGVAVAGILFANVLVFFGDFSIPPERAAALPTARADAVARFLEHVFVQGKFYSIFSLLFGIGFGVQLARGGDEARTRFRRRLKILLGIGAMHAVFIWAGDILMLYALLGFALMRFEKKSDAELLRWTVILLSIPTALYVVALAIWMILGAAGALPPTGAASGAPPPQVLAIFERVGTGGVWDAWLGNLVLLAGRWGDLVATMRFPKVLGMFVLGLWTVRTGLAIAPHEWKPVLRRWRTLGWTIGLPANIVAALAELAWPYLPPSAGGLLGVVMQAIGFPMLALGYAATIALLVVDGRRGVGVFAPVGRMALTNYLMHSVVCVILASGFGFGLYWRLGPARAMGVAAVIIAVQIPLSACWLSRHRFGPAEHVWRRLTYGRPL